ncbi:enoyl-CoA hydratase/isomerase family protein [Paraconexibacter algicola]|uniref:Enoyl-CoA hydratase n=1 Tax=Paraconexibacter algicola TaxID=2133960 RepID=A0A2T4UCT1_9ACTN|nr:enoyl-CoA hydratase/isomerase family protein [Paraconexibacter algicola]PTL55030.1 enoyl-CoA hydratase [Paraconexibacter algicola]
MSPLTDLTLERHGGVAVLTLDAPDRRNALTIAMARAMIDTCEELDADPTVGAVVVRGAGGYFCAGGERATLARAGEDPAAPDAFTGMGTIYRAFHRVGELQVPTIAAIHGGAVGAGMNLAFATDLRIVARDAKLASGFIPIGLHPGGGHGVLLGRTGARETTAALALFGERITGEQAVAAGLAYEALDADAVDARALELAAVPARDPELARRTTLSLRTELGPPALPWGAALEMERSAQMWSMRRKALGAQDA